MIERLLDTGSILELEMRRCALVKDTLRLFPIGTEQSTRCGGETEPKKRSVLVGLEQECTKRFLSVASGVNYNLCGQ